ncbi:MAG: hypothetical protein ABI323_12520, partial [Solirubrobacteraceae bacterium]
MARTPSAKVLVVAVTALIAAGAIGYLIGHRNRGAAFTVGPGLVSAGSNEGTAYLGANQPLDRQPRGFAYFFPPSVAWIDATGSIHDAGQRPTCVPINHPVRVKEMEAVVNPIHGAYVGTV